MMLVINIIRIGKKSVFLPSFAWSGLEFMLNVFIKHSFAPAYVFANAEHTCSNKEEQYSCSSSPVPSQLFCEVHFWPLEEDKSD